MKKLISNITETQGFKAMILIVLTLVMLAPLSMVRSLITERAWRASEVKQEISSAAGGTLRFSGPVLKVPGVRRIEKVYVSSEGRTTSEFHDEEFSQWYTPENLNIKIILDTENKYRGIFYTPVFTGNLYLEGSFLSEKIGADTADNEKLFPEQAELVIPFFNQKGIKNVETALWQDAGLSFLPGDRGLGLDSGGIYSLSPVQSETGESDLPVKFNIVIAVGGAETVAFLPLGTVNRAEIQGNWPSPSFSGLCLPDNHVITETDFSAEWNCSSLSSGLPVSWNEKTAPGNLAYNEYSADCYYPEDTSTSYIRTDLINVHDHYEQNERAAKYAVLFILIPFITLFMFEHFFNRKIHIIQYILAGTANIIFFLLLLSFSEHISFNLSFLISSAAVTLMMGMYTYSVLGKDKKAWYITPVMISVYLFLFITLQSEDWALLIGSSGVFAITGFLMFVTRKIDFYQSR